ncbi:MAG: adenosylmethionine--8-amino-7-oxononanoate transaminase [Alphaproteobacteria bacterium CG11_big_fil_rev_8_21_14_0_20_44_7]|nr:MAG: adenosylmethionine--8-amino-7-oxononanoate transaminase [Alphaproteobacteria bacterium CG11_big_fil_rev_8_21_14_0_20_44_7]
MKVNLDHIWLPYTQHAFGAEPLPVVDAEGCRIKLADGRELIDGISSWWSACHGYKHPHLVKAIQKQAEDLSHVMFAGLVHEPALKLAERLAKLTKLPRIFFSDSGSTAIEVAMKMAVQYWRNNNKNTKKQKFLHFTNSYHGDTMGAMSISERGGMHSPYVGHVPMQFVIDVPSGELDFEDFDKLLEDSHNQIAAVIIEPLIQCAGGFKFHSPDVLAEIYRITKKHEVLFIADEIATGFGRTGYMFACEEAGIIPDIMCIGKALTGGMISLAAACASAEVFEAFLSDKLENALMHGPTFMANPLACAAANASLDLFESEPRLEQIGKIEQQLYEGLKPCESLKIVKDVRIKGALGVVELHKDDLFFELREKFIAENVWIRPFGNVVYLAPPLIIEEKELQKLINIIYKILKLY